MSALSETRTHAAERQRCRLKHYQGRYAIPCLLYRDAFLRQSSPRQRIRGFAIMRYRNLLLTLTYSHWHTTRFQVVTSLTLIPTALDNFRPQCTQNFEWFRHSSEVRYRDQTFVPHRRQTTPPVMMLSRTVDVKLFFNVFYPCPVFAF